MVGKYFCGYKGVVVLVLAIRIPQEKHVYLLNVFTTVFRLMYKVIKGI